MNLDPAITALLGPPPGAPAKPKKPHLATVNPTTGQLQRLSVSQLERAQLCLRKWFYRYVLHIPEPKTAGQSEGTDMHALMEQYLPTGENVLNRICQAGVPWLPEPGPDLIVEQRFDNQIHLPGQEEPEFLPELATVHINGVPLDGKIDLINPRALLQPWKQYPKAERLDLPGTLELLDHKFLKDLKYAAQHPEQLSSARAEKGLQMIGYGVYAIRNRTRFPNLQRVRLTHVTYKKKGAPEALRTSVVVSLDQIEREWESVKSLAASMQAITKETDPKKVPANENACTAFGGCAYRTTCPISQTQQFANVFEFTHPQGDETMSDPNSLLDSLGLGSTPPPAAPVAPAPDANAARIAELQRQIAAMSPPAAPAPVAPVAPHPTVAAVLPPDAPASDPAKAAEPFPAPKGESAATGRDAMGSPLQGQLYMLPNNAVGKYLCSANGQWVFTPADGSPGAWPFPPGSAITFINAAPPPAAPPPAAPVAKRGPGRPPKAPKTEAENLAAAATIPQMPTPVPAAESRRMYEQIAAADGKTPEQVKAEFEAKPTAVTVPIPPAQQAAVGAMLSAETPPSSVTISPAAPTPVPLSVAVAAITAFQGIRLFIGCRPGAGNLLPFERYVDEKTERIAAHYGVKDVRLGPPDSPIGYNKWGGVLAAAVRQYPPAAGDYYVAELTDSVRFALEALVPKLSPENVIRAA